MVILRLKNPTMCYTESNKNINGGKEEKIIVYCGFEIFILPETSNINGDIPLDFQGSLCETAKSSLGGRPVLPGGPASGGPTQDRPLIQS